MADDVQIEFGAKTDGIDRGSAAVSSKLKQLQSDTDAMASQFKTAGDTITEAFNKAAGSMEQFESGLKSAFEALRKGSLSETELVKLLLGGTIGVAIAEIIKSVRDMGEKFKEMEKNAREATLTLEQYQNLQHAVKDEVSGDKFVEGIQKAAEKWNDLNHGASEQKKLLDLNNVAWRDQSGRVIQFNDYIMISAGLIKNARTEVDKFKIGEILGFSREWVRVLQDGPVELKKATDEAAKLDAAHRKLIARAAEFDEEWKAKSQDWGEKFKAIMIELFPYIERFVNFMLDGIGAWITILGTARTPALAESITAAEHAAIRTRNQLQGVTDQFNAAVAGSTRFKDTFEAFSGGIPGMASQFKKFVDENSNLPKYWQQTYNQITETGKAIEKLGEEDFFSKTGTKIPSKDQFDPTVLRELKEQLDEVKEKYQQQKVIEQTAVDTFKQTETEKIAHLRTALAERETATNAIFAEEIMKYGDSAKMRASIERNFNREKAEIELEGLRQTEELLKKRTQEWESSLSGITGAFNSQLRGLLAGTTSWSQAMKNITGDLVIKMIEEFEKLAIVKPLAGIMASMFSAPTELITNLIKMIANLFGPLFAGFTAFFAPVQGPAAPAEGAAAAAATVAAATASVAAFEAGTDYVPRTGLAMVHQGEAIIPAAQNQGGSIGGVAATFNISAWDGPSIQQWLRNGGAQQIARHVASVMNSNPTMRPSY